MYLKYPGPVHLSICLLQSSWSCHHQRRVCFAARNHDRRCTCTETQSSVTSTSFYPIREAFIPVTIFLKSETEVLLKRKTPLSRIWYLCDQTTVLFTWTGFRMFAYWSSSIIMWSNISKVLFLKYCWRICTLCKVDIIKLWSKLSSLKVSLIKFCWNI